MGASYIFAFQNSIGLLTWKLSSLLPRIHRHAFRLHCCARSDCFIVMGTRFFSLLRCRGILICHNMYVCMHVRMCVYMHACTVQCSLIPTLLQPGWYSVLWYFSLIKRKYRGSRVIWLNSKPVYIHSSCRPTLLLRPKDTQWGKLRSSFPNIHSEEETKIQFWVEKNRLHQVSQVGSARMFSCLRFVLLSFVGRKPTFRRNILSPFSGLKWQCWEMEGDRWSKKKRGWGGGIGESYTAPELWKTVWFQVLIAPNMRAVMEVVSIFETSV
jgi:hypothetical protein